MQTQNLSRTAQTPETRETLSRPTAAGGAGAGLSQDAVRERAGQIYQARMKSGQPGDALSDWLQAERELKTQARLEPNRRPH